MSNDRSYALPAGHRLDQYTILHTIGGGGFSFVYLARDELADNEVVIKEFMPHSLARRNEDGSIVVLDDALYDAFTHGRRLFFQEANFLASLKHANIVNVVNFFRAGGTVYMVMDYEKGVSLQEYINRHKGGLSEQFIRTVFLPLLDGLNLIHSKGLLHLDIKPGNIYLRAGGTPILLDFGAVHEMKQTRQYQPGQVITPGFSSYEQSIRGGYVGPWSDIYSIGATMRACLTGDAPPNAADRRMEDKMKPVAKAFRRRYTQGLLQAIDWALEIDPTLRPQSVAQLLDAIHRDLPEPEPETLMEKINDYFWRK
ncbi:serine/threonine protein kinase [Ectothiorhodospiraceae bacterium BW-2]|nr:serine/threonine protein kinase [Ectothiorhodospiraceae bacterium BW-2]